ncbi:MAG: hypothetical protein SGPRY_005774, partial [Prymnesium sp.]
DLNVAVHIRRGDMVYRNFYKQLSPDAYFINAMWYLLATISAHSAASGDVSRRVIFHIFSEPPPLHSWTGASKVCLKLPNPLCTFVRVLHFLCLEETHVSYRPDRLS